MFLSYSLATFILLQIDTNRFAYVLWILMQKTKNIQLLFSSRLRENILLKIFLNARSVYFKRHNAFRKRLNEVNMYELLVIFFLLRHWIVSALS